MWPLSLPWGLGQYTCTRLTRSTYSIQMLWHIVGRQLSSNIFSETTWPFRIVWPYPRAIYMYMTIIFKHPLLNHLETRHGPSGNQRFIYIVYINDDTGLTFTYFTVDLRLFYSKVKFCQNCSLCFRPSQMSVYRTVGPLVCHF